uniref:transposase n=1 Tax=Endozoicomonas gorgoniicola TaxID=1234144 RepID=UPI0038995019
MTASENGKLTFSYRNSESWTTESRPLQGEDFLWLVLQHVLPKGLRRVRDYGFLHCRCRKLLRLVQLILQVIIKPATPVIHPKHTCQHCSSDMRAIAFKLMRPT